MTGLLEANGLSLNGLGSKAVSMGGAFIGLADDFSLVYWNPAGAGFSPDHCLEPQPPTLCRPIVMK